MPSKGFFLSLAGDIVRSLTNFGRDTLIDEETGETVFVDNLSNLIRAQATVSGYFPLLGTKLVLGLDHDTTPAQLHFQMGFGPGEEDIEHIRVDSELYSRCFHHVAGTYDGATMRLYLNGVEIGSNPVTGVVNDGPVAEFGWGDYADTESFFGALDDLAIYDRALEPGACARRLDRP